MSGGSAPTAAEIEQAARAMAERYAWRLVTAARLATAVRSRLAADARLDLEATCEQEASCILYAACANGDHTVAGEEELKQEELAYRDLSTYLTALTERLPRLAPGAAWEDVVQETLLEVYRRHGSCREPENFLHFAAVILKRKGAATWRRRRTEPLDPSGTSQGSTTGSSPRSAPASGSSSSVDPEGDQDLLRCLRKCLDTDEERLRALWTMLGLKRREWVLTFEIPLRRFDYLTTVVKKKLLNCVEFLQLIQRLPRSAEDRG